MVETTEPSISCAANKVKEGVMEMKDAVATQTSQALGNCTDGAQNLIKSAPYKSVLIAFGIGALVSALVFRRRD